MSTVVGAFADVPPVLGVALGIIAAGLVWLARLLNQTRRDITERIVTELRALDKDLTTVEARTEANRKALALLTRQVADLAAITAPMRRPIVPPAVPVGNGRHALPHPPLPY